MTFAERFWIKVDKSGGPESCWPWVAAFDSNGYGKFFIGKKDGKTALAKANRVAWELVHGPIPTGLCSLHHCDNPACCNSENPNHLYVGTRCDNQQEMVRKNRHRNGDPRGVNNGRSVLTEEEVLEIRRRRKAGESLVKLASEFGVVHQMISRIALRQAWNHV